MKATSSKTTKKPTLPQFQSWPAWVALVIITLLYQALPAVFYWGPRVLMVSLVTLLIVPLIISHRHQHSHIHRVLNLSVNVLVTFYMIISVCRLIVAALQGNIGPTHLLLSALTLWATNILVFALWYWSLDRGGPAKRALQVELGQSAFLFPQMQITLSSDRGIPDSITDWQPSFIDYLFLSFNTSTAFSPTDTPVLTRWAKCMSMIQAMISLTIVVMLAARAINTLAPQTNYLVT